MADMVKWDPFKDLTRLYEDVDNLFTQFLKIFSSEFLTSQKETTNMTINVEDMGKEIVVTGDIPNAVKDSINVILRQNNVIVSGETSLKKQNQGLNEYHWSRFTRACTLPASVKSEVASVSFENGKLLIRAPKV